jgi:tripeptidyl-peptidase II
MMEAVRLGCDVINLSFGEGAQLPNRGRVMECAEELVRRHNIIFVSSAGNNGPALSSVNALGGMTSCILGVGAYVSPDMMKAAYSITSNTDDEGNIIVPEESIGVAASTTLSSDEETPTLADVDCEDKELVGTIFTWSSAGPATDGFNGVSICAPGGAIAPVSNWTMQKSMLMSGTSMSSPHACGCIALLISACKAEGIPISPPGVKRALENTAKTIPNLSFPQQGWGVIQVDKAFEYLKACKDMDYDDVDFDVVVDSRSGNGSPRGIYLRQAAESSVRQTFNIHVNPIFKRDDDNDDTLRNEAQRYRIQFEMKFVLQCTESWVSAADHLILMNNGRSFKVSVDPTNLPAGVHTAKVCGIVADHRERGVMWYLPITVVKPMVERRVVPLGEFEVRSFLFRMPAYVFLA